MYIFVLIKNLLAHHAVVESGEKKLITLLPTCDWQVKWRTQNGSAARFPTAVATCVGRKGAEWTATTPVTCEPWTITVKQNCVVCLSFVILRYFQRNGGLGWDVTLWRTVWFHIKLWSCWLEWREVWRSDCNVDEIHQLNDKYSY